MTTLGTRNTQHTTTEGTLFVAFELITGCEFYKPR